MLGFFKKKQQPTRTPQPAPAQPVFFPRYHALVPFFREIRNFSAGVVTRLNDVFTGSFGTVNSDLMGQLELMRARSRSLMRDNNHAKRFIQMCATHIVGPNGFLLNVQGRRGGKLNQKTNDLIEDSFYKWARRGVCESTGHLSFVGVQELLVKTLVRDGEAIVKKIKGTAAGNAWDFALQVLAVDRLDTGLNKRLDNGGIIKMGVELNAVGRPVAYHFKGSNPAEVYTGNALQQKTERIPADQILHIFLPLEPEQVRGVPWMHTAMETLQKLGTFHDAALIAANVGAAKMGFFTTAEGSSLGLADSQDSQGRLMTTVEAGVIDSLPAGTTFQSFDPTYPEANYGPFVKSFLQAAASGLGVSYATLANDLEGVNYSSIRAGVLEERDNWMLLQNWFAEAFLIPVYEAWLDIAILKGLILSDRGIPLSVRDRGEAMRHVWQGRRWAWVDPLKDIEATIAAINNGLMSRTEAAAQQGRDLYDVWAQLQKEQDDAKSLGLNFSLGKGVAQGTVEPQQDNTP
jgi:lambda family phage portal protein